MGLILTQCNGTGRKNWIKAIPQTPWSHTMQVTISTLNSIWKKTWSQWNLCNKRCDMIKVKHIKIANAVHSGSTKASWCSSRTAPYRIHYSNLLKSWPKNEWLSEEPSNPGKVHNMKLCEGLSIYAILCEQVMLPSTYL